ncbi:hypothetical protein K3181_10815 [Qipengyuania sp. YG27]|uniref:Uncharacterized protein n=1 Tax=Qipengyuania mesophila TaxID=2867246 RepID=A0ABS7JWK7_9SPHN|nr:hypothetical protein [Qipengyuania mesophila]MBX7501933.1 hypothetical protein [Qipengyuania mesophila]
MKLSQRLATFFRASRLDQDRVSANDSRPWVASGDDFDRQIAEWTELIEGGVPPASLDAPASPRNDNHCE